MKIKKLKTYSIFYDTTFFFTLYIIRVQGSGNTFSLDCEKRQDCILVDSGCNSGVRYSTVQDCTISGVILTHITETLSPLGQDKCKLLSLNYQSTGIFAAVRRISRSFGSYWPCVCRHQYPRPQEEGVALVYTDCSQAQPSGPNQLSLTYLVPAPLIGPFEIFSQPEVAVQPKRARLEQASSSLVPQSVKQNGV